MKLIAGFVTENRLVHRQESLAGRLALASGLLSRLTPLIVTAIYLACILLVNPAGEFPLNDDWSYTRSAFRFARENRMQVDEFAAPSLVGQALYGGILGKIFGTSFLMLRLSTIILSLCTALLLWNIFLRLGIAKNVAWIALLAWIFNPIQFCLAFSYMTEVPFLFFITLAINFFVLFLQGRKTGYLTACGAALGYAFLIRQTALLFMGAAALALLVEPATGGFLRKFRKLILLAASSLVFVVAYLVWMRMQGGPTAASSRKFELLQHLSLDQILGNSFGLLLYLAFMLMPLWICLVPQFLGLWRRGATLTTACVIFWGLLSCSGLWWFHWRFSHFPYLPARAFHAQMPFLLNILYDSGLGPITLDPTYYGPPPTPVYPAVWLGITVLTAAGLVVMGSLGSLLLNAPIGNAEKQQIPALRFALISFLAAAAFEVVFSHVQEGGLFDRHLLIAALPLTVFICLVSGRAVSFGARRIVVPTFAAALLALSATAWFSITATHDYLAWNRLRWDLGNKLLAQKVDPLTFSGGFEFNAWHNYDAFRARGNVGRVFYWWYDVPAYLVAMEPQEGYRILRRMDYFSWLHRRRLSVYLLEKIDAP